MYLTGFADEASPDIEGQIRALSELGWRNLEARNIDGTNLTLIPDAKFDEVCEKLATAGMGVNCFGSGIANWAKKLSDPPDASYDEMKRAIPRMRRLGTRMIRIMSFALDKPAPLGDTAVRDEVIKRIRQIVKIAEDGGVVCVHENCTGWAGQSWEHTLALMDAIRSPALKLVFDSGNPVYEKDIRGPEPYRFQDAWEFYRNIADQIVYIHIKDGFPSADGTHRYCFPGEGEGSVKRILTDLHSRGYDGGLSIEPHMAAVVHEPSKQSEAGVRFANFVEYGRRVEKILAEIGFYACSVPRSPRP
jgi:sugar phosphate isomerase/epimerase